MARINIEIDAEIHKTAKMNALILNKTLAEYINDAIKEKNKSIKKR